jgi:hypothetical protein
MPMMMANDLVSSMMVSLSRMEAIFLNHSLSFCTYPSSNSSRDKWKANPKYHGNSLEPTSKKIKKMIKDAKKVPAKTYPDTLKSNVYGIERIAIERFPIVYNVARR